MLKIESCVLFLILFCFHVKAQTGFEKQEALIQTHIKAKDYHKTIEAYKVLLEQNLQVDSIADYSKNAGKLSKYFKRINAYDSACYYLTQQIEILAEKGYAEKKESARLWSYLAVRELKRERFLAVEKAYLKAIFIYDKNKIVGNGPAYCHHHLSQIYQRFSDYTKSIAHLEEVIKLDTNQLYMASTYANLANAYHYMGKPDKVLEAYKKGLPFAKEDPYYLAYLNGIAAPSFVKKGAYSKAAGMLQSAFELFGKNGNYENQLRCATELAELYVQKDNKIAVEKWFQKALHISNTNNVANREKAKCRYEYGVFLLENGQQAAALQRFQSAMHAVWPNFSGSETFDMPSYTPGLQEVYAHLTIAGKGRALLSGESPTQKERFIAAACFDLAFQVATTMRQSLSHEFDKVQLATSNQEIVQLATDNLYQLYLTSKEAENEQILERLYMWVEANRASALQDNLLQQKALVEAALPDSFLLKENTVRKELANLRHAISFEKDSDILDSLKSLHLKLQLKYEAFLKELQAAYPAYQVLTSRRTQLPLGTLQEHLPENALLLCYSNLKTGLLRFQISKEAIEVQFLDYSAKQKGAIKHFVEHLSDRNWQVQHQTEFFDLAYSIGQFLLPDIAENKKQRLWIIPDGQLVFLPFETLLVEQYSGTSFGAAPWLVQSFDVAYSWHPDLFFREKNRDKQRKNLHFAPFMRFKRDSLSLLANSGKDCPTAFFEPTFEDEKATASAFFQWGETAQITHVATHAYASKGIEFSDRLVSIPELYGHRFKGDLLCLSACETGLGDLATGEGLLSLARAFAGSGSRSLVASLWSINDTWTAQIFHDFYTFLDEGETLSASLSSAKRAFLQSDVLDPYKAPASWAALTLSGSDGFVNINPHNSYMLIFLWILLGAIAAFGFLAFIRNSNFISEKGALTLGIVVAALIYVIFALIAGQTDFIKIEVLGVLLYGLLAYFGWKKHIYWLGIAWLLHPIWDIGLHLWGEGQGIAPAIYAWMCLSFDVLIAVYIFFFMKKK